MLYFSSAQEEIWHSVTKLQLAEDNLLKLQSNSESHLHLTVEHKGVYEGTTGDMQDAEKQIVHAKLK